MATFVDRLGAVFPNLEVETDVAGKIKLHDYMADSWFILFSHPKDLTPVCTTELGKAASLEGEFAKRGVKLMALSCDGVDSHLLWRKDIETVAKCPVTYPIIADTSREVASLLGMLDDDEKDSKVRLSVGGSRFLPFAGQLQWLSADQNRAHCFSPLLTRFLLLQGMPLTVRKVFIVGPDRKIKATLTYPTVAGRSFAEILRLVDALQLGAKAPIATPVEWQPGQRVMIQPFVSSEEASKLFPGHETVSVPSGKAYIRMTEAPSA